MVFFRALIIIVICMVISTLIFGKDYYWIGLFYLCSSFFGIYIEKKDNKELSYWKAFRNFQKWIWTNDKVSYSNDTVEYGGEERKRHTISQRVKDQVWRRDGGKCVECGSNYKLEFDHIIPHSKGGANTYRNIQLLCEPCNRSKGAKIG